MRQYIPKAALCEKTNLTVFYINYYVSTEFIFMPRWSGPDTESYPDSTSQKVPDHKDRIQDTIIVSICIFHFCDNSNNPYAYFLTIFLFVYVLYSYSEQCTRTIIKCSPVIYCELNHKTERHLYSRKVTLSDTTIWRIFFL